MSNRMLDAKIAVEKYGWTWEEKGFGVEGKFLVPPVDDERRFWTAMWDDNGIPHFLPKYSEEVVKNEMSIEGIEYRWERGYDLTDEVESNELLDDFEWLLNKVKKQS